MKFTRRSKNQERLLALQVSFISETRFYSAGWVLLCAAKNSGETPVSILHFLLLSRGTG